MVPDVTKTHVRKCKSDNYMLTNAMDIDVRAPDEPSNASTTYGKALGMAPHVTKTDVRAPDV